MARQVPVPWRASGVDQGVVNAELRGQIRELYEAYESPLAQIPALALNASVIWSSRSFRASDRYHVFVPWPGFARG